ncbi:ATP-dependent DNA helicase RecQ [Tenacibaculum sp. MAR_2009_124]|uniref:RecQ family ATP-dependent DNA helicase n=1 Tax=Tenacibaculum sp. MAR_2009_124 TaxID=1250059 RepID=UPI00089AAFED|nr:ATP-dependent DNA helicase RecQ [Tenacibaculum sp. MAR_2009_124]SEC94319.1 ATP-dependent DNA helicase RecQ [Tenacibaculum sp. MAR_2009_124]
MPNNALHILKKYWGHDSFREPQQEIISSVLEGNDTIALLPTGGGKSICFQLPALLKDGVCIVVSPLVALIQDQVDSLINKNIKATTIPAGYNQDEIITLFDNIRYGNYKFLYISPERLQSKFIQEKIKQLTVNIIAIDEAHCISEWGHDFRPSYLNLEILNELHPNVPTIALTATATKKVITDIGKHLRMSNEKLFTKSFVRENLAYQVFEVNDKLGRLERILKKINAPIIIYVSSRKKTKEISNYLNALNFKTTYYHGGLTSIEKQTAFDNWFSEKCLVMVATNAFGMGIDKPNVRAVIHLNLPSSLENYTQEAGRAGRDGKKAFSVVLTNTNDFRSFEDNQTNKFPSIDEVKTVHQKLYQHFQITKGEIIDTPFNFNFLEFCDKYSFKHAKTKIILQLLNSNGIIELNTPVNKRSSIQFLVRTNQLVALGKRKDYTYLIQTLLRLYGGVFEQPVNIDEFYIAKRIGATSFTVIEQLEKLESLGILSYQKTGKNAELYFLQPREDDLAINRISKNISSFLNQKVKKAQQVLLFIKNKSICRAVLLVNYFNDKTKNCGICDVCLKNKESENRKNLDNDIIQLLSHSKELFSNEICEQIHGKEEDILIHLRKLLADDVISLTLYNKYFLK